MHRLTWHRDGLEREGLQDYFLLALVASDASVTLQDADGRYIFIANLPEAWHIEPDAMPTDLGLFGSALAERLAAAKQTVLANGGRHVFEATIDSGSIFDFRVSAMASWTGSTQIVTSIVDVTEIRRSERILRELLLEVSHRSKNLLAVIQSIVAQTARVESRPDVFLRKFRGRLYSLAHSQDLVTDSGWRGATVHALVDLQVVRSVGSASDRIEVTGDDVWLDPNAVLHVGLALHELVANAITHGGFLTSTHRIRIAFGTASGINRARLEWREETGGPVDPASDPRFGDAILRRIVPIALNGAAAYDRGDGQLTYRLEFPYSTAA